MTAKNNCATCAKDMLKTLEKERCVFGPEIRSMKKNGIKLTAFVT